MIAALILTAAMSLPLRCAGGGVQRFGATNMTADIAGEIDTRPGTRGTAGSATVPIHFVVPSGCRVIVTRVYGDFIAAPNGVIPAGQMAYALFGLGTDAPDGSTDADLIASNTFLYYQAALSTQDGARIQFDVPNLSVVLPDGVLTEKVAVFFNTTGLSIHLEPSFVVVFEYLSKF